MNPKAANLARLAAAGLPVPEFTVLTSSDDLRLPPSASGRWSVRSCAPGEDGSSSAQAGRFTSHLDVPAEQLPARVAEVCAETGECIVQAMLEPECSGVLFTANPQGLLNEMVLTIGAGAGAVVTGDGPTRTWRVIGDLTTSHGTGPVLDDAQLTAAWQLAGVVRELFGAEMDVELAWQQGQLFVLQARPITALDTSSPLTLDNSNLVESYPGLSLPLTQSFADRVYRGVYRGLARRVLGRPVELPMVTGCNGRLYYRLDHHYRALALLPGARWLVPVWERSMGMPHRTGRANPWSRRDRLRAALALPVEFATAPRRMRALDRRFRAVAAGFDDSLAAVSELPYDEQLAALEALLGQVEDELVEPWAVTLVNDLHAFFWTAAVQALAGPGALAGVSDLESMRPLRALADLAAQPGERTLDGEGPFAVAARAYLAEFGDRYLAELKLESPTFRTHPELLLRAVEQVTELPAPQPVQPPRGPVGWLWRRAAEGARNREVSRLHRARIFGFVRSIALAAGRVQVVQGHLDQLDDLFWLTLDELFQTPDRAVVAERQRRWQLFGQLPAHPRLVFAGEPFDTLLPESSRPEPPGEAAPAGRDTERPPLVQGLGASPGVARGPVCLVGDPGLAPPGSVLVAVSTDPGWVFAIGRCAAVVAERGSLLSHTAIVSRELGRPFVVEVARATSWLRDGDLVEVDGTAGTVRLLTASTPETPFQEQP